jgi:hypothetical protein
MIDRLAASFFAIHVLESLPYVLSVLSFLIFFFTVLPSFFIYFWFQHVLDMAMHLVIICVDGESPVYDTFISIDNSFWFVHDGRLSMVDSTFRLF